MLCRERHKFLSERLGTEIQENSDDFSPVQLSNAPPAGIPKGNNTRTLLQRVHGAVEEDTLKVHLEQICLTWEKFRPQKAVRGPAIFSLLVGFLLYSCGNVHLIPSLLMSHAG
jgi:hypothetical protein